MNTPLASEGRAPAQPTRGSAFTAACASAIFPGIGQWLAGFGGRAAIWMALMVAALVGFYTCLLSPRLFAGVLALNGFRIAIQAGSILDAFAYGRRPRRWSIRTASGNWLSGIALLCLAVIFWMGVKRVVPHAMNSFGVRYLDITTEAMRPTIEPGDTVLAHRFSDLRRWDIVTFRPPGRPELFTQRVVGLPGEKVEIVGDSLQINGRAIALPQSVGPYAGHINYGPRTGCAGHPISLGADEYFLLCDNPAVTYDSRSFESAAPGHQFGAVPREAIVGRITAIYWPLSSVRKFE